MSSVTVQLSASDCSNSDSYIQLVKNKEKAIVSSSKSGYSRLELAKKEYIELVFNKVIRYSVDIELLSEESLQNLLNRTKSALSEFIDTNIESFNYSFILEDPENMPECFTDGDQSGHFQNLKLTTDELASGGVLVDVQENRSQIDLNNSIQVNV